MSQRDRWALDRHRSASLAMTQSTSASLAIGQVAYGVLRMEWGLPTGSAGFSRALRDNGNRGLRIPWRGVID